MYNVGQDPAAHDMPNAQPLFKLNMTPVTTEDTYFVEIMRFSNVIFSTDVNMKPALVQLSIKYDGIIKVTYSSDAPSKSFIQETLYHVPKSKTIQ